MQKLQEFFPFKLHKSLNDIQVKVLKLFTNPQQALLSGLLFKRFPTDFGHLISFTSFACTSIFTWNSEKRQLAYASFYKLYIAYVPFDLVTVIPMLKVAKNYSFPCHFNYRYSWSIL